MGATAGADRHTCAIRVPSVRPRPGRSERLYAQAGAQTFEPADKQLEPRVEARKSFPCCPSPVPCRGLSGQRRGMTAPIATGCSAARPYAQVNVPSSTAIPIKRIVARALPVRLEKPVYMRCGYGASEFVPPAGRDAYG